MKKKLLSALLLLPIFVLSGCNDSNDDHNNNSGGNNPDVNNINNPVVSTPAIYNLTDMSAVANESVLMTYKMKGVKGEEIHATALVFTPKTEVPNGGWPIVVWAHGTTGVADQCAPSRHALDDTTKILISKLLTAGYVVIAPDYEGLGEVGDKVTHPFLNVKSQAYSITDAVVATRDWLKGKTSKDWVTVGHSQGGNAALGAAQYQGRAQLDYKGTVAVAPASNLEVIFTFSQKIAPTLEPDQQRDLYASLNTFTALVVAGTQSTSNVVNYNDIFLQGAAPSAKLAETLCPLAPQNQPSLGLALASKMYELQTNDLTQANFMAQDKVKTLLEKTTQPLTEKVSTPIIIYQGKFDSTVPQLATDQLVISARKQGTVISEGDYRVGAWTHGTAMSNNVNSIFNDVEKLFNKKSVE